MKNKIIKRISFCLIGIISILLLGGCSKTKGNKNESVNKNDILVIATANDIGDLNAHGYSPMYGQNFLYDGLTTFEKSK